MDENKLKYFISAARHLSFTKAAEDMHVVQSTISKQILALEQEIGAKLFFRQGKALALTDVGRQLADNAEDYMEQYRRINEDVGRLRHGKKKPLRLGIGPYEYQIIEEVLVLFHKLYPEYEVSCSLYTYQRLVSHLRSDTIDLAIGILPCALAVSSSQYKTLGQHRWVVVASENHDFWQLPRERQALLDGQTVVTLFSNNYEPVHKHCIKNDLKQAGFVSTNQFLPQMLMVRSGIGIALIPESLAPALIKGLRVDRDLLSPTLNVETVIAYNPSNLNATSKAFLNCYEKFHESRLSSGEILP